MDKSFRKNTLYQIAKEAGILADIVDKAISSQGMDPLKLKTDKIKYTATLPLSGGAQAAIPENPFGPNGEVNIMFQFRYLQSAPPGVGAGINTVVVYADVSKTYGDPNFISQSINTIINYLKKFNPSARLGKYGISAFSGGYYPVELLLRKRDELKQKVGKDLDAVILGDAGHTRLNEAAMSGFIDYAKEAANPQSGKKFVSVHSAIPGVDYRGGKKRTYTSTTEHANYILNHLGLERHKVNEDDFENWRLKPKSVAHKGGFTVIQADDDPKRAWNPKNTNAPGSSGWVHNEIARTLPLVWNQYLKDWNY